MYYRLKNLALTKADNKHSYLLAACIIVGKERYFGWNSYKTSPKFKRSVFCETLGEWIEANCMHAEMHALHRASINHNDLSKAKIKIARVRKNGEFTMSRPCKHCQKMMKNLGVKPKNISYTGWDGMTKKLLSWDEDLERLA